MDNTAQAQAQPTAQPISDPIPGKIDAGGYEEEFKNLSKLAEIKVLAHDEILNAILETLDEINFKTVADLKAEDNLPQKHLLVLCINELLAKVKERNFDLALKDDFIFAFNGAYWKGLSENVIKDFLGEAAKRLSVYSLEAQGYEFKEKLYKQFLSSANFQPIKQTSDVVLINLQNGTFEISKNSQTLREFRAKDFLTYQLPFEFDQNATCPMFQKYLDKVLPEKELQNILAEFSGYVFTKGLKLEKALLPYGGGANGKSVYFDVINAVLGSENISNFSLSDLLIPHNRALIAYKLLNYGSEINASTTKDVVKNLISGEPIQACLKYKNAFTMENYAKLAFNCNELPREFDHQHAYFRRLLIIPFKVKIPDAEQDATLAEKIVKAELAGVFNWIIDGLKRLLKAEKFSVSQIVTDTLEGYKKESDSVAMFIDENGYKPSSKEYKILKELYADYRSFCIEDGSSALKRMNFKKRLETHGFLIDEVSHRVRVYLESTIKSDYRDEVDFN
jgi:putative DNA primase/helicase